MRSRRSLSGDITGVPTGFKDLDKKLAGLHPANLVVIAARPSMGKSALALNIARNAALDVARSAKFKQDAKVQSIDNSVHDTKGSEAKVEGIGVRELVGQLDANQQQVIELIYFQGYTHQETSDELQLPLGTEPADWIPRVAEMLVEVLDLPPRASKLLQSKLFRLYRQFGVFEGNTAYPTLFDLFEEVKSDKKSDPQARMAILDSLEPVLLSMTQVTTMW